MLRSMTGFGASDAEAGEVGLRVEVRSVNHRHLLVKTRLASDFASLDGDVERLVKRRVERGAVTVHLTVDAPRAGDAATLSKETAARYRRQIAELAGELGLEDRVSLDTLLSLPGVVAVGANGVADDPGARRRVLALVDEALGRLQEMRAAEGAAIEADLRKHATATRRVFEKIERRMPAVVKAHQKSLERRVTELLGGRYSVEPTDVAREAALLADKLDVSEEVSRLRSHLEQLEAFLEKGGRIGRKLDFLVQEIFREINTLGSKCSDAKVAHWVVDAKTHAERLREQVQNVE